MLVKECIESRVPDTLNNEVNSPEHDYTDRKLLKYISGERNATSKSLDIQPSSDHNV